MAQKSPPSPPVEAAGLDIETLQEQDSTQIAGMADYLSALAEWKQEEKGVTEAKERAKEDAPEGVDEEEWETKVEEAAEMKEVPWRKASTVEKTIDGRDYIYAQWWENGGTVSEYICPKNPADSNN